MKRKRRKEKGRHDRLEALVAMAAMIITTVEYFRTKKKKDADKSKDVGDESRKPI